MHMRLALLVGSAMLWTAAANGAGTGYIFVSNEQDNTVSVIDGASFEVIKVIKTGQRPRDMRWSADKTRLMVAASVDDRIDVIDVASLEVIGTLPAGEDPEIFDVDPSGEILVASNEDDNEVTVTTIATAKVRHVSIPTLTYVSIRLATTPPVGQVAAMCTMMAHRINCKTKG